MLTLDRLTFAYPQGAAFDFSLALPAGQIGVVTGRSGAGKSTLLDLIAGFAQPQGGALTLDGQDLLPMPPEARPASLLFQSDNLFDHLTVNANLALGLRADTGGDRGDARMSEALEAVGLPETGKRRITSLSGGQQQRIALARTLLRDRPVLLLDEPFSALDEETADLLRVLVSDLTARHGWHTLLVSHRPADTELPGALIWQVENGALQRLR